MTDLSQRGHTHPATILLLGALAVAGCAARERVAPVPFPTPRPPESIVVSHEIARLQADVTGTALSLRGIRYRDGGSNPSEGFDCSGFIRYVFGQHGLSLPGGVRDLYVHGRGIPRSALRAGDLVFFRTITTAASHVAIALGTEEFIHAPSGRGFVRVDSLRSPYWSKRYVAARRVL